MVRRHGTPSTSGIYILHEGALGVFDETLSEEDYDDIKDADGGVSKMIRNSPAAGSVLPTNTGWRLSSRSGRNYSFAFKSLNGPTDRYQVDFIDKAGMVVAPGGSVTSKSRLFAGAKKVTLLDHYAEEFDIPNFDLAIDFGWFYFLTKPFFYAINWLNGILGNFGLATMAFTVLVKLVFFPLANKSYRSMGKMRLLAPKIQSLRERCGDDRMALNKEMMALYKAEQVNPAAGCLPVLLQIPFSSPCTKCYLSPLKCGMHHSLAGLPICQHLTQPLFSTCSASLPYSTDFLPSFLQLGVWPISMGIPMFLQMRLNPAPPDPIQAKVFQFMPLFFTFLLATFPAGLVIYWTWNNLLSMAQQWFIMKRVAEKLTLDQLEAGRLLFAGQCDFIAAANNMPALPPITLPEVCFAGRSNVGKSSLVNALTGRKTLGENLADARAYPAVDLL